MTRSISGNQAHTRFGQHTSGLKRTVELFVSNWNTYIGSYVMVMYSVSVIYFHKATVFDVMFPNTS